MTKSLRLDSLDIYNIIRCKKSCKLIIKIDVEGAEEKVLRGAINTIIIYRAIIIIEVWHHNLKPVINYIKKLNYKAINLGISYSPKGIAINLLLIPLNKNTTR